MKTKFVVITGGPGAGKTAVLEMARQKFCRSTAILPEAASVVFSGGFWRLPSTSARMAAQRAIFHVQDEMERLVVEEGRWAFALCDRGSIDGLAYWPADEASYWAQVQSDPKAEFAKYAAVIHLRVPSANGGYNHQNSLRIETPEEAARIDARIEKIWCQHPNYVQIPSFPSFLEKASFTLDRIRAEAPDECVKESTGVPPR